jgi:5'-phosphate synthase pdxT subunit
MHGIAVGVAAVQGAVSEHLAATADAMEEAGMDGEVRPVRTLREFGEVGALIIPGGESTSISKLLVNSGIHGELLSRVEKEDLPVMGTCAGLILLARKGDSPVERTETRLLGLMDMAVERNAFGRQRESFEAPLEVKLPGPEWERPFHGVFIRAPGVTETWGRCEPLCSHKGKVVAARQGRRLALAFHPELAGDLRFHRLFLESLD